MAQGIGQSVKELAVTAAMAQLDKTIEDLSNAATRLCERTLFVRRQEPQDASLKCATEQGLSSVPLVAQLDGYRARLNDIRRNISTALEQMEI